MGMRHSDICKNRTYLLFNEAGGFLTGRGEFLSEELDFLECLINLFHDGLNLVIVGFNKSQFRPGILPEVDKGREVGEMVLLLKVIYKVKALRYLL